MLGPQGAAMHRRPRFGVTVVQALTAGLLHGHEECSPSGRKSSSKLCMQLFSS